MTSLFSDSISLSPQCEYSTPAREPATIGPLPSPPPLLLYSVTSSNSRSPPGCCWFGYEEEGLEDSDRVDGCVGVGRTGCCCCRCRGLGMMRKRLLLCDALAAAGSDMRKEGLEDSDGDDSCVGAGRTGGGCCCQGLGKRDGAILIGRTVRCCGELVVVGDDDHCHC
jgi:hypothetical protein